MTGLLLARDLALLGAESAVAVPADQIPDAHQGWPAHAERWAELGARLREHEAAVLGARPRDADADTLLAQRLCEELGLSRLGYWLVLCCAAVELHPEAAAAMSILAEDERVQLVTPMAFARLMRAALAVPVAAALAEVLGGGATQRLGMIETVDAVAGRPLTQQGLRLARAELSAFLAGAAQMGASRALHVRREAPASGLVHEPALVLGAATLLDERGGLCLRSRSPRASRQLALDIATALEREALLVTAGDELPPLTELTRLRTGVPILDLGGWPAERPLPLAYLSAAGETLPVLIVLVGASVATGRLAAIDVAPLSGAHAQRVWSLLVDSEAAAFLAHRFRVSLDEARSAARETRDRLRVSGASRAPEVADLAETVRAQGARRMGRMVENMRSSARLSHLVVPPALRRQLDDIVGWYRASERVQREYALAVHTGLGRGLSCLFSGQPGTGKTFAAQCLANELGLNLYRIDLSQVVSKYIGETEKALAQVFDEAEAGHGILLFDEADALFGKRTEVKDAHDRYANVEVGYLLQRLEAFAGVAILTTNLRSNIDTAFVRRLRFVLEFPMPEAESRQQLWEQALPPSRYHGPDLDIGPFVHGFRLSGGHIHNIGLAAAHLAAASADGLLSVELLVRATFRELEKAGLSRSPADFGPLAAYLPEAGQ